MEIIDGKKIAQERLEALKSRVEKCQRVPSLAVVLVGDDKSSQLYVALKEKATKKVGIDFHVYKIAENEPEQEVLSTITFLREDPDISGIIVQLPLPQGFHAESIIEEIGPEKDADGFHPVNIEKFIEGDRDVIWPVFPQALIALAQESGETLVRKRAVIIGKSDVFTQAMVAACTRIGLQPLLVPCAKMQCMQAAILSADVIFTACGQPKHLTKKFIKPGAVIIDGGISIVDGKTVGDVDQASLAKGEGYLSPVPGGVGPMTIVCLLENVVTLCNEQT